MIKSVSEFLKGSLAELKQVIWPTKSTVVRLTLVVLSVSLLTGLIIGGLDYLFLNVVGLLVK
ncbi:preprotein translocase subunit SecE [Microgenomates group bacterium]|nr:preprotein translocase subunit SecE [Patescibacteria group bacterium]MCG2691970.1 preprotein translocase subunit SecE [Microgenomates group bacterium]